MALLDAEGVPGTDIAIAGVVLGVYQLMFNRVCLFVALLWLLLSIPLGIVLRPTTPDFGQFYIGGAMAARGEWSALYPIPLRNGLDNPGLVFHAWAKPRWKALCRSLGAPDYTRFILPPPSAYLFVPLSLLTYNHAFWIWTLVLIGCVWCLGVVSGRLYRGIVGAESHVEGVLALLICFSPLAARAIRIANVTPVIALMIGVTLLALQRRDKSHHGAAAMLIGSLLKYATLVLLPLLLVMRRWRMLIYLMLGGTAVLMFTYLVAGRETFMEFYNVIVPTLSRPSWFRGNQSLSGMLARIVGRPFSPALSLLLKSAAFGTISTILALLFFVRRREWEKTENLLAGAGLLVSWLLVFSPISWEHWPIFLCPMWAWLLWEAKSPGPRRAVVVASLVLMYFPAGIFGVPGFFMSKLQLPEPWNSTQLVGNLLCMGLAFERLRAAISLSEVAEGAGSSNERAQGTGPTITTTQKNWIRKS